jgi:hypothetical protein
MSETEINKTAQLVESFAFVAVSSIPRRSDEDRLGAFRDAQAAERRAAGEAAAKGLLDGKALTDNTLYESQNGATRTASRAKALVTAVLADHGQRPSVSTGGNDTDGWRWWVVAKALPTE